MCLNNTGSKNYYYKNVINISESTDYIRNSTHITFNQGYAYRSRSCFYVTINEDEILEYNETFNVILTENSSKLAIPPGRNIAHITIREDNDGKCMFSILGKLVLYRHVTWVMMLGVWPSVEIGWATVPLSLEPTFSMK